MTCSLCTQHEALTAHGAAARSSPLRVDLGALREALGRRAAVVERALAKASGRPTVNTGRVWALMMSSLYSSGDLPVLATREALQNAIDAIRAAVRARQIKADEGRFKVTWQRGARALTWEDNGVGMDAETILGKFLSLGDSGKATAGDSGEAAGGFGIAKAVILGVSKTFRWELHTRDNLAVARGADADVEIFQAEPRQGTKITVHDLDPEGVWHWDRARGEWLDLEERLHEVLAANDLPGVSIVYNGINVSPMFSRRGGAKVAVEADWGPSTTAAIKAYRRPPGDRGGAYYVRLNGLFQFKHPSFRGELKADVVLDLSTTARPGEPGYPLTASREGLQGKAAHAVRDLADEVERESERAGRSEEDEVFDPESDDPAERAGADDLAAQLAAAMADEGVQRALGAAVGGILDFYAEAAKSPAADEPAAPPPPPGSKARPVERIADPVLPAGFRATVVGPAGPVGARPAEVVRGFLAQADEAVAAATPDGADRTWVGRRDRGIFPPAVEVALDRVERGEADPASIAAIETAIELALDAGMAPGGAGLLQVASAPRVLAALDEATGQKRPRKNPFGAYAGLRISKKHYDRAKARRFRAGFARWTPYLLAWDGVLRVVAAEARVRRRFKPGFVLDDTLLGLATQSAGGLLVISIHPDRMAEVVRAHKTRPIAIAAFLHSVAVHELTHADGRMGKGHDEEYVAAREDLGHATAHLLPALAALVVRLLGLPEPPDSGAARAERLAAKVDRLEAQLKEQRAKVAAANREIRRLQGASARGAADPARPADRLLQVAGGLLRAAPPDGFSPGEIDAFLARNEPALVRSIARALAGGGA